MTETQKRNPSPALQVPSEQQTRYYFYDPIAGWQPISARRAMAIYQGRLCVPEWAGKAIRIAIAYIDVDEGKLIALSRLTASTWKIGDDGYCEQADQLRRIIEKIDGIVCGDDNAMVTQEDAAAIRQCLRIGRS